MMPSTIQIKCLNGLAAKSHLQDLVALRITVFREYPYLYDGEEAYEKSYLHIYTNNPNAIVVLAFANDRAVGACTAMPLQDDLASAQAPFLTAKIDIRTIFYIGDLILLPEFRGQSIGKQLFIACETTIREQGYPHVAFCTVDRPANHPRRPIDWQPLDDFWQRLGYQKQPHLHTTYSWKEIGEATESLKPMTFWTKQL